MVMDQPVIDYNTKGKKKGSMMASRSEVDSLNNLSEAWKEKRKGQSFVGKKVNLDEFLKEKV